MTINSTSYMESISGQYAAHELYFSIHHKVKYEDGHVVIPGKAFKDIHKAVGEAFYWTKKGHDVYMAMGGQQEVTEYQGEKNGHKFITLKAVRKRHNINLCSCIYLDIDVKATEYASTNEAISALRQFIKKYDLPLPTIIVESGTGGLHVYWVTDELFSADDFFALASALVSIAQEFGLKFDPQCTNDICRLLRIPDTWNFKQDPALPVKLSYSGSKISLVTLKEKLNVKTNSNSSIITSRGDTSVNEDELGTPAKTYPLVDINAVAAECPFIKNTLATGGKDQPEPIWKQVVFLSTFCIDGRAKAHEMSKGHGAYSLEETDHKYDQSELDKHNNPRLGPTHCSTLQRSGVSECTSCPHLSKNISPINLPSFTKTVVTSPVPVSNNSDLPNNYYRTKDGHIWFEGELEVGATEVFTYPIIYNSAYAEGGEKDYQMVFTTIEGNGVDKIVKLPMASSKDRVTLSSELSKNGLPMMTNEGTRKFMTAFMSQLRSADKTLVLTSPLGWHTLPSKGTGFSYNGVCYFKNNTLKAQRLEGDFAKHYSVMGNDRPWRDLSELIILQNRPEINAIIAASFAAPLMLFTGHTGGAVGIWSSKSGVGKSTGLAIGQAVWGSTIRMSGLNDTLNQTIDTMATLKNIIVCWDELKGQKQIEQFAQLIFELSRGREKGRLDRTARQMVQREFDTLMSWTANQPLGDEIAHRVRGTAAGNYRMLEFNIDDTFKSNLSVTQVSGLVGDLRKNYGHIGMQYAKYLGEHHDELKITVPKLRDFFEDKLKGTQAERYWISMAACIYGGARLSNMLDITKFDIKLLKDFLFDMVNSSRNDSHKTSSSDLAKESDTSLMLGEMLHFFGQQTIKTDIVAKGAGRPTRGSVKVLNDNGNLSRTNIVVQISKKPVLLRVTDPAISLWCKGQGMPKSAFITALQKHYTAKSTRSRIGSGTDYVSPPLLIWEIDLTGTPLEQEIEF